MKIAILSRSAVSGGAAIAARRLAEALRGEGRDAVVVSADAFPKLRHLPFLAERAQIFLADGLSRHNLWKVDSGSFGLPLWQLPEVREANALLLGWTNQGFLSLDGIRRLAGMGKKIVWTMHDMWPFTGICHHSMECRRYEAVCGSCPYLHGQSPSNPEPPEINLKKDLSTKVQRHKGRLYGDCNIKFVAVSNWLAGRARASSLLKDQQVTVIPNPFSPQPLDTGLIHRLKDGHTGQSILFAAEWLDNWIKGLDTLRRATAAMARRRPDLAATTRIVLAGGVKDRACLEGFALPVDYVGKITDEREMAHWFAACDVTANCSEFENLPTTLIEGQAYGAVPVAFDRGGQSDIVEHLSTGYLAGWHPDPERRAEAFAEGLAFALDASRNSARPSGQGLPQDAGQPSATAAGDRDIKTKMRSSVEARFAYRIIAREYLNLLDA